eukprot:5931928-Amphidinium_carterae.1
MREWQRRTFVQSAGADVSMPPAAEMASHGWVAQTSSADGDVDMPPAAGVASSSLHPASAVILETTHLGTLLDETPSASVDHTSSQAASAAREYGPNEAAHMRMCACPGIDILAYADDIILVLHPEIATPAWELWKVILARHNLKVQADKTV